MLAGQSGMRDGTLSHSHINSSRGFSCRRCERALLHPPAPSSVGCGPHGGTRLLLPFHGVRLDVRGISVRFAVDMEPHMPAMDEPALPASLLGGAGEEAEQQIPDYLECLREARKREKEDDELLAQGKLPPAMAEAEAKMEAKRRKALAKKNTGVYVTGLPVDTDEDEFVRFMTKYGGLIKKDAETRRPVVKLYKDEHGTFTVSQWVPRASLIADFVCCA